MRRDGEWWLEGQPVERPEADAEDEEPHWHRRAHLALGLVSLLGWVWVLVDGWEDLPDVVAVPFLLANVGIVLLGVLPPLVRLRKR